MKLTIEIKENPRGNYRAELATEHKSVNLATRVSKSDALEEALKYALHEYQRGEFSPLFGGAKAK